VTDARALLLHRRYSSTLACGDRSEFVVSQHTGCGAKAAHQLMQYLAAKACSQIQGHQARKCQCSNWRFKRLVVSIVSLLSKGVRGLKAEGYIRSLIPSVRPNEYEMLVGRFDQKDAVSR